MHILVVGAGPTGLTTALEMARRGLPVDIVDKRDTASGLSRAVGILPASIEILRPSGVADRLLAEGIRFREVHVYRGAARKLTMPLEVTGEPDEFILGLAQDRTEQHLRDGLNALGVEVRFGVEVVGLTQDGTAVEVRTADGAVRAYDHVVGADGAHSIVRAALGLDFPGHDLPETWSIADVDAVGWPNPTAFTVCQLSEGGIVVVAPLERARFRVISNTEDALAALPLEMNVTNVRRAGQFTISVRQVERYRVGRVFLAGDAAHCHSPVGGRGMNLGIADGADLARRFVEGDLDGYDDARHAVAEAVIRGSETARRILTSSSPLTRLTTLAVFKAAGVLPPLRRRIAQRALYG